MSQAGRLVGILTAALCARVFLVWAGVGVASPAFGADAPPSSAVKAPVGSASAAATAAGNSPAPTSPAPTVLSGDFLAIQQRYIELYQQTLPAVVKVNCTVTEGGKDTTYFCTGFFISRDGYILTTNANHLQDATRVTISHEGISYLAEVKGLDLVTNLALLRAVQLPNDFNVISLGDGSDLPSIGTLLLGVACKLDLDPTLVNGMVAGYTADYGATKFSTLHLRTNIEDDNGAEGSPLLDLQGHLAGIMIAALPDVHASLVLPTRAALRVRDDLLKHGHVIYGSFGFESHEISDAESGTRVLISSIVYGGPALVAGLRANDQLLSLGDVPIHSDADLRQATFFALPGENLILRVNRDGKEVELHLRVGEMEQAAASEPGPAADTHASDQAGSVTGNNTSVANPPPGEPLTGLPAPIHDPKIPPPDIIEKR
jgi:S1-C subfamily serine protease